MINIFFHTDLSCRPRPRPDQSNVMQEHSFVCLCSISSASMVQTRIENMDATTSCLSKQIDRWQNKKSSLAAFTFILILPFLFVTSHVADNFAYIYIHLFICICVYLAFHHHSLLFYINSFSCLLSIPFIYSYLSLFLIYYKMKKIYATILKKNDYPSKRFWWIIMAIIPSFLLSALHMDSILHSIPYCLLLWDITNILWNTHRYIYSYNI